MKAPINLTEPLQPGERAITLRALALLYSLTPDEILDEITYGDLFVERWAADPAAAEAIADLDADPRGWWENGFVRESRLEFWLQSDSEVARRTLAKHLFRMANAVPGIPKGFKYRRMGG